MNTSNFVHLYSHDPDLERLGRLAERYLHDDPNTCLLKLRQFAELLAQTSASKLGAFRSTEETQYELLRRLEDESVLPRDVLQLFHEVRKAGNAANHAMQGGSDRALACLRIVWQLSLWSQRTFIDPGFVPPAFVTPSVPPEASALQAELERLQQQLLETGASSAEQAERLRQLEADRDLLENMSNEAERLRLGLQARLDALQAQSLGRDRKRYAEAAKNAAQNITLDEASTRRIIDRQLTDAGWTADSALLTYAKGARPVKGKNLAIAEWPTSSGPADYVLFMGLMPVAVVEAKRKNVDVSAALQQAQRYSRDFKLGIDLASNLARDLASEYTGIVLESPGGPWNEFQIPFVFSSNARPYLKQLETRSGVWFRDVRDPSELARPLESWYSPEGLKELLKRDTRNAHERLEAEGLEYDVRLRPYQQQAIRAIESGIKNQQRALLVAMATGTGKTKTCIALIYRLLKAKRFRRVLFLVDRSALGEQAANAFKDTRLENLQTFADTFGIKEIDEGLPDADTSVHLATVQGMVHRVLHPSEGAAPISVDQYDCIVVDECHRGYLLDRELSEVELGFRSFEEYVSTYRRVLEYFDAVKIGLTATPALHTTQIFGPPAFTYSYREAVIDGFLVDHEPPVQIKTELSQSGITWETGEQIKSYNPRANLLELHTAPDQIRLEVESFNKKVITEAFNKVVCEYLATELDPAGEQKTLIFCANDAHCDLVVKLLKEAFAAQYGSVDDDAVIKITGTADKPLQLIRRFKNERQPNVAVTVDLLTTGIDVPAICNLVFLRRVNSRILFDQMLGRATRLNPEIGKETFRIFDAVQIYEALQDMTAMQPVVVDPSIGFSQLAHELTSVSADEERDLVREQFLAKLQRQKNRMPDSSAQDFETIAGMNPIAFIEHLRAMPTREIAAWFTAHPGLGEILDRKNASRAINILISEHPDQLIGIERGYGKAQKPADFLNAFGEFIRNNQDTIPALVTVLTRPRDLTRKQLRGLALELDRAGFSETNLATAWREMTNQDIAAKIMGYIRQAATGETLRPFAERVDAALQRLLSSRSWTTPQRSWLNKIAAQTKANQIVDLEALDDPDQIFKLEGGGFKRLDRVFEGQLAQVLEAFNGSLWDQAA